MIDVYSTIAALFISAALVWKFFTRRSPHPHPPGPKGYPFIGNLFDMPQSGQWLKAAEWCKTYGDIIFLNSLGSSYLFINSHEDAVDLLEKRSTTSSSRSRTIMANVLQDWEWFPTCLPYGNSWRKQTAYYHRYLGVQSAHTRYDVHEHYALRLLDDLQRSPDAFRQHLRAYIGSTILMVTYGHETRRSGDPLLSLVESGVAAITEALIPAAFLVDLIPSLQYLPTWCPGAGFRKIASKGRALSWAVRYEPYEAMKLKVLKKTARPCVASALISENMREDGTVDDEDAIAEVTGAIFLAGSDTTIQPLLMFILAMILHPDVQRRAQKEIDSVVGFDRLPSFADRESLPYVSAIIDECLRWEPVVPMGVPHMQTEDVIYNGYFIPKGTTLIPNQWLMLHDPKVYHDPFSFKPERFLPFDETGAPKGVERDPKKIAFGFGRRVCPGQHLAVNSIYAAVSRILAAFDIMKAKADNGEETDVTLEYTKRFLNFPLPFQCSITPRSSRSKDLVQQLLDFS